jgi:serine/threonine protein kinase
MICCLNPSCQNPTCEEDVNFCPECGTELVILENRYRPLQSIGRGGFGKTYLAKDIKKFAEKCVIKQFAPYSGDDSDSEKMRFRDEAKQLQKLGEHPQIPSLLAFFAERGYLYFVQQYVAGENLAEELERHGLFDEEQIREFLVDLLGILQVVHQYGVIHRDVKPYNIMRRQSDRKLVLIDFGISKQLEVNAATGTSIGSLGYSPLEQVWGGKAYPASDLYSLGVTAFYLMSGINPREILVRILEETSPEQAHNWVKNWRRYIQQPVSDDLGIVLDKLLHIDHKQRYQSATEVLGDLRNPANSFLSRTPSPAPSQTKTMISLSKNRFHWSNIKLLFLGVSAGVVGFGILILMLSAPSTVPTGSISKDLGDQPENANAYLERGQKRSLADQFPEALADFNRALQLQPTMAESYNERAQVKNNLKDKQGALADFEQAIKLKPNWGEVYYQRATVYKDLGNERQALADLDTAINLQQNHVFARIERGNLHAKMGNKPLALQNFNEALKIDGRSSYAYMSRAGFFASANERKKAIADYDQAIILDPNSYYQYYERGILHQELNNKVQAKSDFKMSLQLAKKAGAEKDYTDAAVRIQQMN